VVGPVVEEGGPRGAWRVMLLRRVSGRPGAEGAPFETWDDGTREVVFVVEVGWEAGGAIRRD
jgi:hypothetical protein